jgi:hypothetical protein
MFLLTLCWQAYEWHEFGKFSIVNVLTYGFLLYLISLASDVVICLIDYNIEYFRKTKSNSKE